MELSSVQAAVDVERSDVARVVPVVCSNNFWTTARAWLTVLMASVMEVTAVAMEAFSVVVQVTVDDTQEISADRVTTTVASGKEVTIEITAKKRCMSKVNEYRLLVRLEQ